MKGPLAAPAPWRGRTQTALLLVVAVATAGVVGLLLHSYHLAGQITSAVSQSQPRVTNLANAQRESLHLLQTLTALPEASLQDVTVQRGLFAQQLQVAAASFPAGSPQAEELKRTRKSVTRFPWEQLSAPGAPGETTRRAAMALASQNEKRVKALYDAQERHFYQTTMDALEVRHHRQRELIALVALVCVLGLAWVAMLRRRTRSDLEQAYHALLGETEERRAAEEALRSNEARFRSLVQNASDVTAITDAAGTITYISPSIEALIGYTPQEMVGQCYLGHVAPDNRATAEQDLARLSQQVGETISFELNARHRDGRSRVVHVIGQNLLHDPAVHGLVWNIRDVTVRRELEKELTHQAYHDPLTGLGNRNLLLQQLTQALKQPADASLSVVLVDLDGFKSVNDTLGHGAGDQLLRLTAQRLGACLHAHDSAARLGGDEFAVVLQTPDGDQSAATARRLLTALDNPFTIAGHAVSVGASIGIAHRTSDHDNAEDLLRDADIAMYQAKKTGKNDIVVFCPDMRTQAAERATLEQQLAHAVDRGQIEVHYQPVIDTSTGRIQAVEALARWRHPQRGLIPPGVFIPVAEESGAINAIGRDVLRQACTSLARWRRETPGCADLGVSVNVALPQLLSGHLVDDVAHALADSGLPGACLTLELTESMPLETSTEVHQQLAELKKLGVRLAVDDFGTGYSSLGSLLNLNVDTVKIDRSLLDFDTRTGSSLVAAVTGLGHTLRLTVVVEGVETAQHLKQAHEAGCDAAQGYHFSKPLPAADVPPFLHDHVLTGGHLDATLDMSAHKKAAAVGSAA